MNLSPLDLLILALATWRLAYLVSRERAPFNIMGYLRDKFPLGGGTACMMCMSVWTAALMLVLWHTPAQPVVYVAALSGAALMLASWTGVHHASG